MTFRSTTSSSTSGTSGRVTTTTGGCPTTWSDFNFVYYGGQKDWIRSDVPGRRVRPGGRETTSQVAIGAVDMCGVWCGINGTGACHSHAPLIDQVKLHACRDLRAAVDVRDIDLWQDNFPEQGGISADVYARCDMAQDILPGDQAEYSAGRLDQDRRDRPGGTRRRQHGRPSRQGGLRVREGDRPVREPRSRVQNGLRSSRRTTRRTSADP